MPVQLLPIIVRSSCRHKKEKTMSADACQFFMNVKTVKQGLNQRMETVVFFAAMELFHARHSKKRKIAVISL